MGPVVVAGGDRIGTDPQPAPPDRIELPEAGADAEPGPSDAAPPSDAWPPRGDAAAPDTCDGVDNDGDGRVDEDADRTEETCDGLDNDCDREVDEGLRLNDGCFTEQESCAGTLQCGPRGGVVCVPFPGLGGDAIDGVCDGRDDDCDVLFDEDSPCNGCPADTELDDGEVCIPPGAFTRGLERGVGMPPETPSSPVNLSGAFVMSVHEVTVAEWAAADEDGRFTPSDLDCDAPSCPMTKVNWFEAVAFANRRSALSGLSPCYRLDCDAEALDPGCGGAIRCLGDFHCRVVEPLPGCTGYRLPTEAEWERAARSLADEPRWCGEPVSAVEACGQDVAAARPVGLENPEHQHGFGLFDMLGNVAEWSADEMIRYPEAVDGVLQDPRNLVAAFERDVFVRMALRGGSFGESEDYCRASMRRGDEARSRAAWLGLRLVRNLPDPAPEAR